MIETDINNNSTLVKKGYKHTKLGWIPEDWEIETLGNATELLTNGFVGKAKDYYTDDKDGVLYIQGYNVLENSFKMKGIKYVTKEFNANHQKSELEINDLLTIQTGDVGLTTIVTPEIAGANCHALIISRFKKDKYHPIYYSQYFNSYAGRGRLRSIETGSTMKHLNIKDMKKFHIPLPPLPEQQKIASILNTWYTAIATQEKLIAEKQELKNGLMQQLLTGKKRFAGFANKWNKTEIKEIGTIIRGASPRPKGDPRYYGGNVPRLMVKDVTRDGKYVTPKIDFLTEAGAEKSRPCKAGTLTVVCSGDVGVPSFLAVDACIHDGFLAIIDLKSNLIHSDFLYYQLKRLRTRMERSATHGGVFTNLTTTILKDFIIEIPSIKEQLEIITVLSKIDREVDKQELKLKKLISQKQGLMQQLLTGEKRVKI